MSETNGSFVRNIDTISKIPNNNHNTKKNLSIREKVSQDKLKNNPSIILNETDKGEK